MNAPKYNKKWLIAAICFPILMLSCSILLGMMQTEQTENFSLDFSGSKPHCYDLQTAAELCQLDKPNTEISLDKQYYICPDAELANAELSINTAQQTPEPATLSLLAVGSIALLKRRGKRTA